MRELQYKTDTQGHEKTLTSLEGDKYFFNEKYSRINKKKFCITIFEILKGFGGLAVGTSLPITGVEASIGIPIAGRGFVFINCCNSNYKRILFKTEIETYKNKRLVKSDYHNL